MNKREAKKLREEDDTPYAVMEWHGTHTSLVYVTGYQSARVVHGGKAGRVILTASEVKKLQEGR